MATSRSFNKSIDEFIDKNALTSLHRRTHGTFFVIKNCLFFGK